MKKDKIKNKFFKSTIKIAGNKGLGKNFLGKSIKKYLIKNSKTDEIIVNSYEFRKRFKSFFSITPKIVYNPFVKKKCNKIKFPFLNFV